MEEASVMMVGLSKERVLQGIKQLELQSVGEQWDVRQVTDYSMPNVSQEIVKIILGYTDYVNRIVWVDKSTSV